MASSIYVLFIQNYSVNSSLCLISGCLKKGSIINDSPPILNDNIIDSNTGFVKYNNTTSPFGVVSYKLIYDPERESIIIGQYPGNLIEIQVELESLRRIK